MRNPSMKTGLRLRYVEIPTSGNVGQKWGTPFSFCVSGPDGVITKTDAMLPFPI
jgi:hypothetical protein